MKRPRGEGEEGRKKSRTTSVNANVPAKHQTGSDQQRAGGRVASVAQQLQDARKEAVDLFDAHEWSGGQFSAELQDEMKRLFKEKAVVPSACGYWHLDGLTLMNKEAVLVNYPTNSPGVFQNEVTDLRSYEKAQAVPEIKHHDMLKKKKAQDRTAVISIRYYNLAVFNFESLTMYDAQTGESFKVSLGDSVIVTDTVSLGSANGNKEVERENIIRVTEIFMNAKGDFMFRGHYYYQDTDTAIAAAPKDPKRNGEMKELPSGEHLGDARQLWLSGSEEDNDTYENCFDVGVIDRLTKVYQIPPTKKHPDEVPELKGVFDPEKDWYYNAFTVRRFISVEDIWEDWMPWSRLYKELWQKEGVAGIKQLRLSCEGNLTKLMRGRQAKKLNMADGRVLYVMELFAGGGGISHICRQNQLVSIRPGWANDINQAACATYNCNEPDAYVFCQGLEELLQLLIKWGLEVELFMGKGWREKLDSIRQGGPQHKYSRQHMPKGVGCHNSTVGKQGTSANIFVAAAKRGWEAVKAAGLEEAADPNDEAPDWDALVETLEAVTSQAGYALPKKPTLEGTAAMKHAIKVAYEQAVDVQQQRIQQCKQRVEEQELGKVLEVRDVRVTDCAVRVKHGSSNGQLNAGLTDYECWLEYEVKRQGSSEWAWEHQSLLRDKEAVLPMRHFMLRMLADKTIPMPGDVGLLTGGPPCQNMSGLNRHAKQSQVLNDPKNRLVTSYVNITQYLKPSFILMEQVTEILRRENGLYGRYALQQMVQMGYQCRAGICTAGNCGCPQGRRRAVFLGALSAQEQLPAFPKPTHVCKNFNMPFPKHAKHCEVETPDSERPYPMVVMGDVLTDLPGVSNFEESDRSDYLPGGPKSVTQAFLRRGPTEHSRSLAARSIYADAAMAPWQKMQLVAREILQEGDNMKVLEVGRKVLCKGKGSKGSKALPKGAKKTKAGSRKATPAATPAASSDDKEAAAQEEEEEEEQEEAPPALVVVDDDDDENAAEEVEELNAEIAESKNFAVQTWQKHLEGLTEEDALHDVMNLIDESELFTTTWLLGQHRLELLSDAAKVAAEAPLRDHRPLVCNADDFHRICAVPKEKGANFRDMPGVITLNDGTCCAGSWHATQKPAGREESQRVNERVTAWNNMSREEKEGKNPLNSLFNGITTKCECGAGGMPPKPPSKLDKGANDKAHRVDHYGSTEAGAWRGSHKPGCPAVAFWMSTRDLVCPRWCVTYKSGLSNGRHGCFGRVWFDDIQTTVVTRAEPHNLQLLPPQQDRVLSVRENARCQGFPDYHVFVGLGSKGRNGSHGKGAATVDERYMQIGNAVSPMLSACLGECLCLAAAEESPVGEGMISVKLHEYEETFEKCKEKGFGFWCQEPGNIVDQTLRNDFYWKRHKPAKKAEAGQGAASGRSKTGGKKAPATKPAAAAVAAENDSDTRAPAAGSGKAPAAGSSKAAAATSGGGAGSAMKAKTSTSAADKGAAAAGSSAGTPGAAKRGQAKRKDKAVAADDVGGAVEGAGAAPAAKRNAAAAAAGKSGGTGAVSGGRSRPERKSAAAAKQAVHDQLELESTPVKKHRAKQLEQQQRRTPQKDAVAQRDTAAAGGEQQQAVDGMDIDKPEVPAGGAAGSESDSEGGAAPSSNRSSADVIDSACDGQASRLIIAV